MLAVASVPGDMISWFEGCPCHSHRLSPDKVSHSESNRLRQWLQAANKLRPHEHSGLLHCPMRGMRAPELAMGEHLGKLRLAAEIHRQLLVSSFQTVQGATAVNIESMLTDFDFACSRLIASVEMKTSYASTLPFSLCGAATVNEVVARNHVSALLQHYDKSVDPAAHDRVTLAWCQPGRAGGLRADLDRWVETGDCSERLARQIAAFRFIPLLERRAEQPHAKVKTKLAFTPAKGLRASLAVRTEEIFHLLRTQPEFEKDLTRHMERARTVSVVETLGLSTHPYLVRCREQGLLQREHRAWHKHIVQALYRHDWQSAFCTHSGAREKHKKDRQAEDKVDKKLLQRDKPVKLSLGVLLGRLWVGHVRATVDEGSELQLPASLGGSIFHALTDHLETQVRGQQLAPQRCPGTPHESQALCDAKLIPEKI